MKALAEEIMVVSNTESINYIVLLLASVDLGQQNLCIHLKYGGTSGHLTWRSSTGNAEMGGELQSRNHV